MPSWWCGPRPPPRVAMTTLLQLHSNPYIYICLVAWCNSNPMTALGPTPLRFSVVGNTQADDTLPSFVGKGGVSPPPPPPPAPAPTFPRGPLVLQCEAQKCPFQGFLGNSMGQNGSAVGQSSLKPGFSSGSLTNNNEQRRTTGKVQKTNHDKPP